MFSFRENFHSGVCIFRKDIYIYIYNQLFFDSFPTALRIHISKQTYIGLKEMDAGYHMTERGEMNVKVYRKKSIIG